MNKENLKIITWLVIVSLIVVLFAAAFYARADDTVNEDVKLYIEDRQIDNTTAAGLEFQNMSNITDMNCSIELSDLNKGMISSVLVAQESDEKTNYSLHILTYNNAQIEIYRYCAESITEQSLWSGEGQYALPVVNEWIEYANSTEHFVLGNAHSGDVLEMAYNISDIDNATDTGNMTISFSVGNYSYSYLMHSVVATNASASNTDNYTRSFLIGSVIAEKLSFSDFSYTNLSYKARCYNDTLFNVSENYSAYNGHYFLNGENFTAGNSTYATVYVVSPARVYASTIADVAGSGMQDKAVSVYVQIQSWFLENAMWIVGLIFLIILVDIYIDGHDYYQDNRKKSRKGKGKK